MKLLLIHADYIEYEAKKKAIKKPEEIEEKKSRIEECIVAFQATEKEDEGNQKEVAEKAAQEIENVAKQVKANKVVIYPFVHLSENPSSPESALQIIDEEEKTLKKTNLEVHRSPFGWYKSFEVKCKGHPLAELSRKISSGEQKRPAKERKEETQFYKYYIIDKEGQEHEVEPGKWKKSKVLKKKNPETRNIRTFVQYELGQPEENKEKPAHIELMKNHELVDYCDVSDSGHFKWFPKGLIIKELILAYQDELARAYGAFKIQNPLVYRIDHPEIKKLIGEFNEKIYTWDEENKKLALRPASDPGAFPYMHNINFSYKQMPLKEYEEAICFRKEQRGELSGLKRVRNFLMTDVHAFTENMEKGKEEFEELCFTCKDLMNSIISEGNWVLGWETTKEFWEQNKEWIKNVNKEMEVPGLVKIMKKRSHYYSMKNEFQAVYPDGTASQISTVQIDEVNGKRFDINYTGKDNEKHPCTIIHCSTFGSIERSLASILENAARSIKQGKEPKFPLWLSPTQLRLIPVSDESLKHAEELAAAIEKENIRVDIDDNEESVGKKIRRAEKEWIPVTIVIGPQEEKTRVYKPRIRGEEQEKKMSMEEIQNHIQRKTAGYPYKPLPLPKKLSKRPIFK